MSDITLYNSLNNESKNCAYDENINNNIKNVKDKGSINNKKGVKAVALLSGGLDSNLVYV